MAKQQQREKRSSSELSRHEADPAAGPVHWSVIESPVGPLLAAEQAGSIVRLNFLGDAAPDPEPHWVADDAALDALRVQLGEYFAGERTEFELDVRTVGTEFQMAVWAALREIPFGETATYGDIAEAIGRPRAVRAVGGANHANPVSIVVPCHRVIGADGSLTGFGGGLGTKETLLGLEARALAAGAA